MIAIHSRHPDTAAFLIASGADVNAQEPNGWAALMFAAMHGDAASVRNLIEAGADVNVKTADGETPLHRAAALGREEVVGLLKAAGARE